MLLLMDNNYILLIIIYENLKKIFSRSESLRLEICYYTCPASEFENSVSELNIFYLPPVFENGGRYCFGVRRRLRRLRGCFALYLGCY